MADTLRNMELVCKVCSDGFTFDTHEQDYYLSHGLTRPPGLCLRCRSARARAVREGYVTEHHRGTPEDHGK
jgi:hypothetical protein